MALWSRWYYSSPDRMNDSHYIIYISGNDGNEGKTYDIKYNCMSSKVFGGFSKSMSL